MNTAVIAPPASARRIRRWTLPGRIASRLALALARLRSSRLDRLDGLDERAVHELQRDADRLRAENFRTVAVGRLI